MNKTLGLLLALVFVGTTAIPAKNGEGAKKKGNKEYKLVIKNTFDKEIHATITDSENKIHETKIAVNDVKEIAKTSDKALKIKKVIAKADNVTAEKEFKVATRKVLITKNKKGELKIRRGWTTKKGKKSEKKAKDGKKCAVCPTCNCKTCKCPKK